MNSYTPLWKRGGRGDFPNIILKSPYIPLCQRGIKTSVRGYVKVYIVTHTEKDWIFVSDAHFSGRETEAMEVFLGFLNSEKERMSHLVILGDLFDFLFGFKDNPACGKPFPFADYLPILEGLQRLYRQGIRIKYFEGNHDFFLHSFFSERFGMEVEVYPEGNEERLGGRRVFLAHGDSSNPGQWTSLFFRCLLKNRGT